jgi:hypothetical protein
LPLALHSRDNLCTPRWIGPQGKPPQRGINRDCRRFVCESGKWKHVRSAAIEGEIYNGWVREKLVIDQPWKTSTTSETALPPAFNPTVTDKPWWEDRTKVDLQYLQCVEKNPSLVTLKMKDADWCWKRDHKDPACVVESEIGKADIWRSTAIPPENYERPIDCPKWLGLDC